MPATAAETIDRRNFLAIIELHNRIKLNDYTPAILRREASNAGIKLPKSQRGSQAATYIVAQTNRMRQDFIEATAQDRSDFVITLARR